MSEYSTTCTIRNIDISLRIKPIITELYFPGPDGEPQPHIGGVTITSNNNPWEDLCRHLSSLPNLRTLHIRLDSEDLRPWHKRVNERKFFEQLLQVKAREFVLDLPDLPETPELQALPGCYLDGDILKEAPYEVKRSSRPNNWQLHLSRVSDHAQCPTRMMTRPCHLNLQDAPTDIWHCRYRTSSLRIGVIHYGIRCGRRYMRCNEPGNLPMQHTSGDLYRMKRWTYVLGRNDDVMLYNPTVSGKT